MNVQKLNATNKQNLLNDDYNLSLVAETSNVSTFVVQTAKMESNLVICLKS
jgi:hypothetical protein